MNFPYENKLRKTDQDYGTFWRTYVHPYKTRSKTKLLMNINYRTKRRSKLHFYRRCISAYEINFPYEKKLNKASQDYKTFRRTHVHPYTTRSKTKLCETLTEQTATSSEAKICVIPVEFIVNETKILETPIKQSLSRQTSNTSIEFLGFYRKIPELITIEDSDDNISNNTWCE